MNKRIRAALAALALICAPGAAAAAPAPPAADFHVAPGGSDANPGTADQPLASLAGARDAVRRRVATGLTADVRVLFRGGTYALHAPVVFGPEDSAGDRFTITYAAYPGETPVFSGGRRITGWVKHSGRVWKAEIPEAKGGKWAFRRLYVNGQRRALARTPNEGSYFRIAAADAWDKSKNTFEFRPGDLRNWPRVNEANVVVLVNWETGHLPITAVDEAESTVTLAGGIAYAHLHFRAGSRYFVENAREALDAPGEWYLDRDSGTLYYYPLRGEDLRKVSVVAPVTQQFVRIQGEAVAGRLVRGIRFEGIHFQHGDYALEAKGHSDAQAAVSVPAAITLVGARDCAVQRCEIANIGIYAVEVGAGSSGIRIEQNEMRDVGAGGIHVQAGSDHTTVHNNFIHDGGSVYFGAIPVLVRASSDNAVTHNEICDFNYSGVSVGWSWGFNPTPCQRNRVEYNHIHHVGRGVMTDLGGIYTLGISTGTALRNNLIHHVWDWPEGYLGAGIYPDEGSTGLLIENNVVYATSHGGVHVHYGRDNVFRNNILAFGRDAQIQMGRSASNDEKDRRKWGEFTTSSMTFERNIVLFERGDLYRRQSEITADRNLYWLTTRAPLTFPGGGTFAQWQAKGNDTHTLVADPRFVNPRKGDFRLRPDSPALDLGFQSIDLSAVGLVGDPAWVRRAKAIRRPETEVPERAVPGRLTGIAEDFEGTKPGRGPRFATVYGESGAAAIRVTDEVAAAGRHCLKVTDAPGLANGYDPHFLYQLDLVKGVAHGQFDLRREEGAAGYHEWRDWSVQPYITGPSIAFGPDGSLSASKRPLLVVPDGQWARVEITCPLGDRASGAYDVTVTVPGKKPRQFRAIPCDPRFRKLTWFGFSSTATDARALYLDNLSLRAR